MFLKYAIKDDVVSGFLYFNEDDEIEYLLHPFDKITGINYRLLPLTRSIISEIIDLEQAMINEKIIDDHLTFNDGVRLMNNTPRYNGEFLRYLSVQSKHQMLEGDIPSICSCTY